MTNKLCVFMLFLCIFFLGCGSQHCFTLEGNHDDYGVGGVVTWCIDPDESEEDGQPVLNGPDGEKSIVLSVEEIEKIANAPKSQTEAKNRVAINALRSKSWQEALIELK